MKRYLPVTLIILLAAVLAACGGAEAPAPTAVPVATEAAMEVPTEAPVEQPTEEPAAEMLPSIAEIAAGNEDFSTLVAALSAAGLVDTLAGEGNFTVFAPTNDAFAALPAGTVDALLADPQGDLTQILLYHVVDGVARAADVVTLNEVVTLNGAPVAIAVVDGAVRLNDSANVITTDIEASNGVIHVIDSVLLPPAEPTASIAEIASGDENFSTLVAALSAAGLVDTLAGEGNFTVFAPTNDAFAALPEGTVEALLEEPDGLLTQILLYHVVDGVARAEEVVNLSGVETLNGESVAINVVDGAVRLNDTANVVVTDIVASNGIIHVIDAVLIPPATASSTIADVVAGNEDFSTLLAALDAAGLVDTLAGEGDFTVFAPTNDAFAALPAGTVEALLADPQGQLTQILLYHVLGSRAEAADVVTLSSADTLQGSPVTIEVTDAGVILNGSVLVTQTDINTTNGVIHVIDGVLLPPSA
jgi:transforming growth factor-beta-induced protein